MPTNRLQYNLGKAYYNGDAIPKDATQAVARWHKAAEQGYASAEGVSGAAYDYGQGVSKDETHALQWIRKAAEKQNLMAIEMPVGR
jgi:uncharacterized protein